MIYSVDELLFAVLVLLFLKSSKKGRRVDSGEVDIVSEVECFKDSGGIGVDRLRSKGDGVLVALD